MVAREFGNGGKSNLSDLENELDNGVVVDSREVPQDVITMNSKVLLRDINTQKK